MREPTEEVEDPEWQESMRRSLEDARAGRVIPARIGPFWTLLWPRWITNVMFWVAPWTWGRAARRASQPVASKEER